MRFRVLLLLLPLSALALPLFPCQAMKYAREGYLPLKIEVFYAHTVNFTLSVTPSTAVSSWREIKDDRYMAFECNQSRDTFLIIFSILYPEPIEQTVTVKFTEGKRPAIVELIQYTNGPSDPYASRREAPSKSIILRFLVRTVAEPTDPKELARLVDEPQKRRQEEQDRVQQQRHQELMDRISLLFGLFVVVVIAILLVLILKR